MVIENLALRPIESSESSFLENGAMAMAINPMR